MLTALNALPDIPIRHHSYHSRRPQLNPQQLQQQQNNHRNYQQHHYQHHHHHFSRNHEQRRGQYHSRMAAAAPQSSQTSELPNLEGIIIHRRWKILHLLGKGAFGEVHAAYDMVTRERHAIKIEPPTTKKQVLRLEIAVLRKLAAAAAKHSEDSDVQACPWVADFIASGKFAIETATTAEKKGAERGVYSYVVMRLLGPNLSDVRRQTPGHRFSLPSISHIAVQMLHAIETLHSIGIVHRDIKPGNFCLGPESSKAADWTAQLQTAAVYMIDFGLSRRYLDSKRQVLPAREKVGFRGTSRYASLRAHEGADLGPADDLWSLFYLIVEFITGSLPWKGREKDRIAAMKRAHHQFDASSSEAAAAAGAMLADKHITSGLPQALVTLWVYLSRLDYGDAVNYRFVEGLLRDLAGGGPDGTEGASDGERVASRTSVFTGNQAASVSRTSMTGVGTGENLNISPVSPLRLELPDAGSGGGGEGANGAGGDGEEEEDEDEIMVFGKPLLRPPPEMDLASSPPTLPPSPPPPSPPPPPPPTVADGPKAATMQAKNGERERKPLPTLPPLPVLDPHLIPSCNANSPKGMLADISRVRALVDRRRRLLRSDINPSARGDTGSQQQHQQQQHPKDAEVPAAEFTED
ncbi:Tau-tubulin kinase 2 [Geranomyces variabilis]|uniref:non-specific serine/threonine protein kinase n=1 Tax=Geranomyces variabilis TaxID=109894 RepID=A0AAD5TPZ1_9FUNG|nr:Tau-tubulin kinase 2 [Geranomyces variabilis]